MYLFRYYTDENFVEQNLRIFHFTSEDNEIEF
jgi:hypothetical protein